MLVFFAVTGSWQLFNWHESESAQKSHGLARASGVALSKFSYEAGMV